MVILILKTVSDTGEISYIKRYRLIEKNGRKRILCKIPFDKNDKIISLISLRGIKFIKNYPSSLFPLFPYMNVYDSIWMGD